MRDVYMAIGVTVAFALALIGVVWAHMALTGVFGAFWGSAVLMLLALFLSLLAIKPWKK